MTPDNTDLEERLRRLKGESTDLEERLRKLKEKADSQQAEEYEAEIARLKARIAELESKPEAHKPEKPAKRKPKSRILEEIETKTQERILEEAFNSREYPVIDSSRLKSMEPSLRDPYEKQKCLERMLEFEPKNPDVQIKLAEIKFQKGEFAEAADQYEKALRLNENAYMAVNGMERCAEKLRGTYNGNDKAISIYRKLISLQRHGNKRDLQIKIALVLAIKSQLSQAESELLRAGLSQDEADRKLKGFEYEMDHILRGGYKMLLTSHFMKKAERESSADKKIRYWGYALEADREIASSHIRGAFLNMNKSRYSEEDQDRLYSFVERLS